MDALQQTSAGSHRMRSVLLTRVIRTDLFTTTIVFAANPPPFMCVVGGVYSVFVCVPHSPNCAMVIHCDDDHMNYRSSSAFLNTGKVVLPLGVNRR